MIPQDSASERRTRLQAELATAKQQRDIWQDDAMRYKERAEQAEAALARVRAAFTNEVIRAVGSLARQQNVCREQGGTVVFVTGMEAAREYLIEHIDSVLPDPPRAPGAAESIQPCPKCGANIFTSERCVDGAHHVFPKGQA